ncbi:very short patch repair endonuclease [Aquipuribacter sp. MA13-6]|uniref:very short patch repair endonuclease n=1 Tax=unclassified Aquipuribacter TaxID=2635084 RepID=UPI003EEF9187
MPPAFHVPVHPGSSGEQVSRRMSTLRRRDNSREVALRRALHRTGLRFRVSYPVPGLNRRSIDVAFTRFKVAVFLDGCFWHGCPEHGTSPQSNSTWWATKLGANVARDLDTNAHLAAAGWQVVRIWEHTDLDDATAAVQAALRARGLSPRVR